MYQRRRDNKQSSFESRSGSTIIMSPRSNNNNSAPSSWSRWVFQFLRWACNWLLNLFQNLRHSSTFSSGPRIVLDTGRVVRQGRQIAEGGYSFVFECHDVSSNKKFALKRCMIADPEMLQSVQKEVGVHRSIRNANVMPLLGFSLQEHKTVAYLLFPYMADSLRAQVNKRMFSDHTPSPWPESTALLLFLQILQGVSAMHDHNYTHRDLKLENVLLKNKRTPVIMDFGSCGPLREPIETRRQVLTLVENAAQHTTLPYRPPELLEGGVRAGDREIDFTRVDVWSLGCTLFAMLYGSSPMECEFRNNRLVVCDCTPLRILGGLPTLPESLQQWYSHDTIELIRQMLNPDRHSRISLQDSINKVEGILHELGERIDPVHHEEDEEDEDEDTSALLARPSSYAV
jgi:serine/threonine kinase 16